jgi:hypothetical protein
MEIRTIEYDFDYQMVQAIRELLSSWDVPLTTFADGDALIAFVGKHKRDFGEIVLQAMETWDDPENWLERARQV